MSDQLEANDEPRRLCMGGIPTPHLGQGLRPKLPHSHHVRAWAVGDPFRTPSELTTAEVVELRDRAAAGELDAELSRAYGLRVREVARVRTGTRRGDCGGVLTERDRAWTPAARLKAAAKGRQARGHSVTEEQAVEMREQAAAGVSDTVLAEQYGVSRTYVQSVRCGKVHPLSGGPLTKQNQHHWSDDELALLTKLRAAGLTIAACAEVLGRGASGVQRKLSQMG